MTQEELDLILDDLDQHLDWNSSYCTSVYDDFVNSTGIWETHPNAGWQRMGSSFGGKKSINKDYFVRDQYGVLQLVLPQWATATAGQIALHETLHEEKWGLSHTANWNISKQSCWDN